MATNNRGANRSRRGGNNNPEGRNQYSGLVGTARDNPFATTAAVGGAVAAGLFLWSRRNQISDQIGNLGDQIGQWREGMGSVGDFAAEDAASGGSSRTRATGRSQAQISEEALTLKETGNTA